MNKLMLAFSLTSKIAFEDKPKEFSVWYELYFNSVFFIEIIKTFYTPYWDDINLCYVKN